MNISRRNVLLGATAAAAFAPLASRAQTSEVVIGVLYPLSGASAQIGVDAQKAFETAADLINKNYDFALPLAKGEGLPGLGGAKIRLVFADHQARPAEGPRRSRAPDHAGKSLRHRRHLSELGRRHRQPDLRALSDPVPFGRQFLAEPASPRPEILFPRCAARRDVLHRDVRFLRRLEEEGHQDRDAGAVPRGHHLRHRLRQRAAQAGEGAGLQDRLRHQVPRQLAVADGRGAAAEGGERRRADALELHHRRYPAGQDHGRAGLQAECDRRAGRRLFRKGAV